MTVTGYWLARVYSETVCGVYHNFYTAVAFSGYHSGAKPAHLNQYIEKH